MTDHDALLRAIIENPAEDTPRLVFADWLDEHADAFRDPALPRSRAAFIRDDIAASRRDEYDPVRLRWELVEKPKREREGWVKESLPAALRTVPANSPVFRRGFPWCVRVTPTGFLAHPERFTGSVPAGTFSFGAPDGAAEKLFQSPHFARFAGLHAEGTYLQPNEMKLLAESSHAKVLEELCVSGGLAAGTVTTLLRSNLLARLTRLDLNAPAALGSTVLNHLHQIKSSRLREVSFAASGLPGAQVERALSAPLMQGVTRLSLAGCRLALNGYEALARANLPNLRDLDLSNTTPGADGFRLLCAAPTLARLHWLSFTGNHVNSRLAAELAARRELSNLRVLNLSANAVGNAGATALAQSPHSFNLLVLDLSFSQVGDEGVEAILESPLAERLVLLDMRGSPASEEMKEVLKAKMGDRVRVECVARVN